jgi:ABC-type nitrate/sulfonate/bicarbonate transport system permease component
MSAASTGEIKTHYIPGPGIARLGVIIALLLLWEVTARYGDRLFVAPPSAVFVSGWTIIGDKRLVAAIWQALWELVVAFFIAIGVGATLGLLIGRVRLAANVLQPIVMFLYSLPQAPLLPLFVLAFGIGPAAKIAFGVTHGVFPMIITVAAGVRDVDASLLRAARSMGARGHQVLWSIVLPAAAASFFTGLRLAMSGVLLGVLLAELFVSQAGIGFYTHRYADAFQPANLLALIVMLAAIAATLNEICRVGENWFNRWRA